MTPFEETGTERHEEQRAGYLGGGSAVEAIGGIAAVILAILGLAGVLPVYMVAIAAVVVGASLVMEGGATASRFSRTVAEAPEAAAAEGEIGGGVTTEFLGGVAELVLGILALLGLSPEVLIPVAAIVFGGALLLGSGAAARLGSFGWSQQTTDRASRVVAREAASTAAATQGLIGIASIILGILAVVQIQPLTLTLVAMLALGTAILISGASLSTHLVTGMMRRA